jgi:hypothetical protein
VGLRFPDDLAAWDHWQRAQNVPRRVRSALTRRPAGVPATLTLYGDRPRHLVVVDSPSPTIRSALLSPLAHLRGPFAVLSAGPPPEIPGHRSTAVRDADLTNRPEELTDVAVVLAVGHYMRLGRVAHTWAQQSAAQFVVVQHGLLSPLMAPLPADAHLLAWNEADANFWWSGRSGHSSVVGSQLLWEAGSDPVTAPVTDAAPTYLGQLHGAELPRRDLARAAGAFCARYGATYRPHPSEMDRLSRWQHARWERRGITVDRSGVPLRELREPVVSVFSTGVLEAAARGVPAWVDFPEPPAWLEEFWERYDMRPYGGDPTPAPARSATEPAAAVAAVLRSLL